MGEQVDQVGELIVKCDSAVRDVTAVERALWTSLGQYSLGVG